MKNRSYITVVNTFFKKLGMNYHIYNFGLFRKMEKESKNFIDFLYKLGFKINITSSPKEKLTICQNDEQLHIALLSSNGILFFDEYGDEIQCQEKKLQFIEFLNLENIKENTFSILKFLKSDFEVVKQIKLIRSVIIKVVQFYLVFFMATILRVIIDTSTYYQNKYVLFIYIGLLAVDVSFIYLSQLIYKITIYNANKILKKTELNLDNMNKVYQICSIPILLILCLYIINNLEKNIFIFVFFIIMNTISLFFISIFINKMIYLKIYNIIYNTIIFIFEIFLFYNCMIIFFNDGMSLGMIIVIQLLVYYVLLNFYNLIINYKVVENEFLKYEIKMYNNSIYNEGQYHCVEDYDIACKELVVNDVSMEKNIDIKYPSNVIIYGEKYSGKTMFVKSLLGIDKINSSKIYLGNRCINTICSEELNKIILYLSNMNINMIDLDLENNLNSDIQYVYSQFGINNKDVQESNSEYYLKCIAKGILMNPKILVLDNILSSLDIESRKVVLNVTKKMGMTLIVVEKKYFLDNWDDCLKFEKS